MFHMVLRSRGYRQVSLPILLVQRIEEYIKEHEEEGYTSVPDFIKKLIRKKVGLKINTIKVQCDKCKTNIHYLNLPDFCDNCLQPLSLKRISLIRDGNGSIVQMIPVEKHTTR